MGRGLAFDNILLGDSLKAAFDYAHETHSKEYVEEYAISEQMKRKETLEKREKRRQQGAGGSLEASVADMLDFINDNAVAVAGTLIGLIISLAIFLPLNKRLPAKPASASASASPSSSTTPTTAFTLTSSASSSTAAEPQTKAAAGEAKEPNGNGDEKK